MLEQLRRLMALREALTDEAHQVADRAAHDERDLTDPERDQLAALASRCAQLDGDIKLLNEQAESARAYERLRPGLVATEDPERPRARPVDQNVEMRSWGELFVASESFRTYRGRGSSEPIRLPGLFSRAAADPILASTFPGSLPPYYFAPTPWTPTTPLLDALGRVTVSSNSIEWYSWPSPYPAAQVVAEGENKPPADYTPVPHTASLQTYAHWKAISRQALEDIPQIQSIVTTALQGGVLRALEAAAAAALAAPGSGIAAITAANLLEGVRQAIGQVQEAGYATPNAVLLNPADFAAMDMAIMAATVAGPVRTQSVWGVPAVAVSSIPAGTAYVGDFATAVTLFARNQVEAYLTDSHADFFIKNLLVLLAEQRALVAVTEPAAACAVTVSDGGDGGDGGNGNGGA